MPSRICNECGLDFDNKVLYDNHWQKCVKTVSFVAYNGEEVTITRHVDGTFHCYCSHEKCPKVQGFSTMGNLHRHMKILKTTWLGPDKKGPPQLASTIQDNGNTPALQISTKGDLHVLAPEHAAQSYYNQPQSLKEITKTFNQTEDQPALFEMGDLPAISEYDMEDQPMKSPVIVTEQEDIAMRSPHQSLVDMSNQQSDTINCKSTPLNVPFIYHPFLASLNLVVNAEFRFLICQLCQEGIPTSTAQGHIKNKHPALLFAFDQDQFDNATRTVQLIPSLPDTISGPRPIIHGLAVCKAFACDQCSTVMISLQKMKEHYSACHQGLPKPQQFRACKAQRMRAEGQGKQRALWEVIIMDSVVDSKEIMVTTLMAELNKELEVVRIPTDGRLVSPWLRTTRWHEHIAATSTSIDDLRTRIALPRPQIEETCCKNLQQLVEQYFQEALELIDTTDELILQRLNSPDPAKHGISNTPFHKHMMDATMKQYIIPVVCLLSMLLRELWIGMEQENIVISKLEDLIEQDQEPSCIIQQIHVVLMKLWTTRWRKMSDCPQNITDPTEAALALMTLNQDGSFKEPKDVTRIIAKLEYCMRLTFLKEIRAQAEHINGNIMEVAACDALQPWFTEKTYSTFSRLRSLQHRASAIAYETMGLPHIWWTDTEAWMSLKYKGNSIAFSDLRDMFQDMENDLIAIWKDKILRGLPLRADYKDLVDDPSNTDVGYSFLFEPKNTCFQDRTRLVRAVIQGQGGFSRFLLQDEDGKPIWNRSALCNWLQDYAALQKLLLLRTEMLSGAPARGTELTAAIYCNTQTRPTRNLMVFGQHVTLLCQYSKTSAMTGHEKLIPHSLDAITSDILIQDLALARPFAQLAAKICFDDETVVRLYKELLFVNFDRKFTSENLSAVMAKYSLPRTQYALTINPWRHIQTAWKRKFKCTMEHIVEIDETENVDALQAGHTRATENRIYGLSTHSLAGKHLMARALQGSCGRALCSLQSGKRTLKKHIFIYCKYNERPIWIDFHIQAQ
ncbi:hypothetical protein L210DRAFT_3509366 [Boletus edulis BED1]|uniref:C2H2-type domain-containing protein n=1 Tax=Boletus edulis BED1 TaxID=1328754 RepID=A0AAD4BFL8_BOLED|nr:hypothetical protein L210DRAFT_3509366 [Boletus edulis BED1]